MAFRDILKKTIKKKMKNVNIEVDVVPDHVYPRIPGQLEVHEPLGVHKRIKFLVWSHQIPDIRTNFETGRKNIDLIPELVYLTEKLTVAEMRGYVDFRIAKIWFQNHMMTENDKLKTLDIWFTKKELPILRDYARYTYNQGNRFVVNSIHAPTPCREDEAGRRMMRWRTTPDVARSSERCETC